MTTSAPRIRTEALIQQRPRDGLVATGGREVGLPVKRIVGDDLGAGRMVPRARRLPAAGRHPVERGSGPSKSACRVADGASIWR